MLQQITFNLFLEFFYPKYCLQIINAYYYLRVYRFYVYRFAIEKNGSTK